MPTQLLLLKLVPVACQGPDQEEVLGVRLFFHWLTQLNMKRQVFAPNFVSSCIEYTIYNLAFFSLKNKIKWKTHSSFALVFWINILVVFYKCVLVSC